MGGIELEIYTWLLYPTRITHTKKELRKNMFFFFLPFLFLFRIGEEKKQTCEETWKLSSRRRRKNAHNFCMYKRKHRSPERLNLKEWII
jgi:hypothetical protein